MLDGGWTALLRVMGFAIEASLLSGFQVQGGSGLALGGRHLGVVECGNLIRRTAWTIWPVLAFQREDGSGPEETDHWPIGSPTAAPGSSKHWPPSLSYVPVTVSKPYVSRTVSRFT